MTGNHALAKLRCLTFDDMGIKVGDAGHRNNALHAVVSRRHPPARRPASRSPRHPKPLPVNLLAGLEVVEGAHGVPALDAGRRVAERVPPPVIQLGARMRAVMDALQLAELQRVDDETDIAVL